MKKILLTLFVLLIAIPAFAETTLKFTWNPNTDEAIRYHLWMDKGNGDPVLVIEGRETDTCQFVVVDDTVPHVFSLTAANDTQESQQSDYLFWTPKDSKPLTFVGTVKLVQEQ